MAREPTDTPALPQTDLTSEAHLSQILMAAHQASGLPTATAAGLAGISESYLSKLLSGRRCRPSRDLLIGLALVWGVRQLDELNQILVAASLPPLRIAAP